MDTTGRRKLAAALAAVSQYRAEVEEFLPLEAPPPAAARPIPPPASWATSGRQHGMLLRDFWQRRVNKSW